MTGDDSSPRTLYVGNLSPHVTEDLLIALFGQIGECKSCKIIHEPGNDPYAFVEFSESHSAASALSAMNKRNCLGKEMKVNWATTSGGHQAKIDSNKFIFSEHYHIFVGDLAPETDQQTLREAFAPYGEISDTKIMKDPHTLVHKGYGFISFVNKADAETAISAMNGQWLGSRKIRTNWATRKVQPGGEQSLGQPGQKYVHKLDYNEVWNRSSDTNTTVYCGGINNLTDEAVRNTFGVYGQITGIHPFPDRGYSFIRFATKEAACSAICGVHGMEVNGGVAKCSWGKENIDMSAGSGPSIGGSMYGSNIGSAALQNVGSLQSAASQLGTSAWAAAAGTPNTNWAAANYQWAAGAGAYPQNAFNQWFQQTGYNGQAYQNAMMQQGWGVMPAASGSAGASAQYQMGQYQPGANGQKS